MVEELVLVEGDEGVGRHTLLLDGRRGGHWPVEGVGDVAALMPLPTTLDLHSSSEAHSQALCRDGSSAGIDTVLKRIGRCRCRRV